ncbi:hypothetical protein QE109_02405 [Fusibacter bizertensis]|uniref:Uncharacterized protein n=1 Tax=Fusibacter bizertensis TaxID=1488331 RepID=A0ABT6N987_9FIRM|nr:hypothetical protein [Fusibacter bizertensis]MDH8676979.1 hypothetical protein [Fusibacter bizertensis]
MKKILLFCLMISLLMMPSFAEKYSEDENNTNMLESADKLKQIINTLENNLEYNTYQDQQNNQNQQTYLNNNDMIKQAELLQKVIKELEAISPPMIYNHIKYKGSHFLFFHMK